MGLPRIVGGNGFRVDGAGSVAFAKSVGLSFITPPYHAPSVSMIAIR
jgi:hypothetical protein